MRSVYIMDEKKNDFSLPENSKKVFSGIKFDVYHWDQEMFDGSITVFEKVTHKPSVQIIAVTDENKLILLEEEQPSKSKFLSLVGGGIDGNEKPIDAAKRELLEETGMKCNNICEYFCESQVGNLSWDTIYFIAKGCEVISKQNLDSGERIKILELDFEEFIEKIAEDDFRNKGFALFILKKYFKGELEEFKSFLLN